MPTPPDITLRRATANDAALLAELFREVHELHVRAHPEIYKPYNAEAIHTWLEALLASPEKEKKFWIAERGGEAVGFISGGRRVREANAVVQAREWCEIDNVAVLSGHQRQGIAQLLLETLIADFKAQGYQSFELNTWWFNETAQAAFQRLGFEPRMLRLERCEEA